MYKCGWQGCEKAYGTLNHLNAHVTMQSHGLKRTPEGKPKSRAPLDFTGEASLGFPSPKIPVTCFWSVEPSVYPTHLYGSMSTHGGITVAWPVPAPLPSTSLTYGPRALE